MFMKAFGLLLIFFGASLMCANHGSESHSDSVMLRDIIYLGMAGFGAYVNIRTWE